MDPIKQMPRLHYTAVIENTPADAAIKHCIGFRLIFFLRGSGSLVLNRSKHSFYSGSTLFLTPGTDYRIYTVDTQIDCFFLDFNWFSPVSRNPLCARELPQPLLLSRLLHSAELARQMHTLIGLLRGQPELSEQYASGMILLFLTAILNEGSRTGFQVILAMEQIYAHYTDPSLTNPVLAQRLGYHPHYINQLVKALTGATLHRHLIDYRLFAAMELLVESSMEIEAIAWNCGFTTASHFIQTFRSRVGMTPLCYRKLHRH